MDIVVLGHKLSKDGSLSDILEQRLDHAAKLHDQSGSGRIFVSGGLPRNNCTEAEMMQQYLVQTHNILPEKIIPEGSSANTLQNALFLSHIAKDYGLEEFVVVTSWYHQRRARQCFKWAFGRDLQVSTPPRMNRELLRAALQPAGLVLNKYRMLGPYRRALRF